MSDPPQPLPTAPCWSAVLKKPPASESHEALASRVFGSCRSSKGISVAVVDANAIIHGDKLAATADKFVSVKEVLEEVRDPASRRRLAFLPFPVETMEPSPDSIKKVVKFARETGDLQTLSDVDIKIIALTYMLESQIHGASHLRDRPPPLHEVKVKNLPEAEMPGWGNNVPNLAEWEALEQATEGGFNHGSRILPLKDLNNQVSMTTGSCTTVEEDLNNKVSMTTGSCTTVEEQDGGQQSFRKPKSYLAPNEEIKIEGKKMVAVGIDTSVGEDTEDVDDWHPAVSRSTHRRYLRRKARREFLKASEGNGQPSEEANVDAATVDGEDDLSDSTHCAEQKSSQETRCNGEHSESDAQLEGNIGEFDISTTQEHVRSDIDTSNPLQLDEEDYNACAVKGSDHPKIGEDSFLDANMVTEEDEVGTCIRTLDNLEITSQSDESVATSFVDDGSSEQSWMLRSLSDSNVACITSDYAMQNVILQIGLRLLAPGGMQIRQLHRWVLKCHACNKVTQEIGRIFCPKCGNGGTLRKVSVTVGENGIVLAARRPRIILRGTKFSLPLPQGGREAITKNLILREDQLPHKLLYPKSKKKPNKKDEDFPSSDDIFSHSADNKRAPLKPPVRKALAVFSGKRNPNDNHFARHKR